MPHELPIIPQADPKDDDSGGDTKSDTKNPGSLGAGKGKPKKP
jgi:hypothetical protein